MGLVAGLREQGFEVIEIGPNELLKLGNEGVTSRIIPTHGDDTLMVISDGEEVCVNLNDSLHSAPTRVQENFTRRLRQLHPIIDYVFCGYGIASHFPNCYRIPGKDYAATAAARQQYFNAQWSALMAGLKPRFAFPFAADVVFLEEELFWVNEPTHNSQRPVEILTGSNLAGDVTTVDIAPGFVINQGSITQDNRREPVRADTLRLQMRENILRANRHGTVESKQISEVHKLLQERLTSCQTYLSTCPVDYKISITFRNSNEAIVLTNSAGNLSLEISATDDALFGSDLVILTRLAYLRWALTRPHGDEILFVGSGVIFDYSSQESARRNLHVEFIRLVRGQADPPRSKPIEKTTIKFRMKQWLKRVIGREERDLYDLMAWTRFSGQQKSDPASELSGDVHRSSYPTESASPTDEPSPIRTRTAVGAAVGEERFARKG